MSLDVFETDHGVDQCLISAVKPCEVQKLKTKAKQQKTKREANMTAHVP